LSITNVLLEGVSTQNGKVQRASQEHSRYDVLDRHHQRNGIPRPPQNNLERQNGLPARSAEDYEGIHRPCKDAKKQSFWPGSWKSLIDDAKLEWRVYLAGRDAFPDRKYAKRELIPDIVSQCLRQYKRARIRLEDGMIPRYQEELYTIVSRSNLYLRLFRH
jgi:hypothetical protein